MAHLTPRPEIPEIPVSGLSGPRNSRFPIYRERETGTDRVTWVANTTNRLAAQLVAAGFPLEHVDEIAERFCAGRFRHPADATSADHTTTPY